LTRRQRSTYGQEAHASGRRECEAWPNWLSEQRRAAARAAQVEQPASAALLQEAGIAPTR
jgi:hypothetical protein